MGEITNIEPIHLETNHDFVADCCRYQEGLLTEARMKMKYGFAENVWNALGDNTALLEAVEDEKIRRIRSGQQKREKSQALIVKAPAILDSIASDVAASPRHRVDAIKTLDAMSATAPTAAAAGTFFEITINLGSDVDGRPIVEHFKKPIAIDSPSVPNDGDPLDDVDTSATTVIPAKPTDDGNE